jgi:ring-1,2-phenylacetyl-CoA epoxidase subunit PaaD
MTVKHEVSYAAEDEALARARAAVAAVPDPEIPAVTIADLGILRRVEHCDGVIEVTLTPTYTGCPATLPIRIDVETALLAAGITDARVRIALSPPWSTDDITEEGRRKLRAYGIAPPPPRGSENGALFSSPSVACPRCGSPETHRISEFGSTPCKALWRCEACREPFDVFKCL